MPGQNVTALTHCTPFCSDPLPLEQALPAFGQGDVRLRFANARQSGLPRQ